ncbi:hypothetical protein GCM10027289_14770 [Tsukamurella serpentis]
MDVQQIAGYRVVRKLGGGGMGEVYLVQHPRLPRQDALKLLHTSVSSDPQYKARFEREAYVLAQLNHRNIIHLYDRGEFDGRLWLTMEYVAGPDTSQMLAQRGPVPLPLAVEIADGAGAALDYAYRQARITHRDVKPANILVAFDSDGAPQVKLADFGIAKAAGEAVAVTSTGITIGTMSYMSPEAFDNRNLDNRADLYSLGCTVFELLTGAPPFPGDSPAAVIAAHLNQPVPRITSHNPALPAHLDPVFRKALAKRPEDRYSSCAEFVAGLRGELAEPVPTGTSPQPIPAATGEYPPRHTAAYPGPHTTAQPAPTRTEPAMPAARERLAAPAQMRPRRWGRAVAAAAVVVLLTIAAATFYLTGAGSDGGSDGGRTLTATSVKQVYFQGKAEASDTIGNVLTGAEPSWRTDYYLSGPGFAGLKSGTGLLITLDRAAKLTSGTITSPSDGSTVQIRIADSDSPGSLDATQKVWDGTLRSGSTDFTASGAPSSKYVLVWITGLVKMPKGWSTTIGRVELTGIG